MRITRKQVAAKLAAYLQHQLSLPQLVDWAERAMMDGEFPARDLKSIRNVVAHLGVADVREFGLTWDDCEKFLEELGYAAHVQVVETSFRYVSAVAREKPSKYSAH